MQKAIEEMLVAEEVSLQGLGNPRPDRQQRLQYLLHIVREYDSMAVQALSFPENLPSTDMKLRGLERKLAEDFKRDIENQGSFYQFLDNKQMARETSVHHPLYRDIRKQMAENRGEELPGLFNPAIVKPIFKKQISKWETLGTDHMQNIIEQTFEVAIAILEHVCDGNNVPSKTEDELADFIQKFKYEAGNRAIEKLKKFCHDSGSNPLYTSNDTFNQKIKCSQDARFKAALQRYQSYSPPQVYLQQVQGGGEEPSERIPTMRALADRFSSWAIIDLNSQKDLEVLSQQMHSSAMQNREDEIHDLLKAYYEVRQSRVLALQSSTFDSYPLFAFRC